MRRKCKSCKHFIPQDEETAKCEYSGKLIDAKSEPMFDEGACYSRIEPNAQIREELSRKRAAAGRKGGLVRGYGKGPTPVRQMCVRAFDHAVFSAFALKKGASLAGAMHILASTLVKNQPDLKPENWRD